TAGFLGLTPANKRLIAIAEANLKDPVSELFMKILVATGCISLGLISSYLLAKLGGSDWLAQWGIYLLYSVPILFALRILYILSAHRHDLDWSGEGFVSRFWLETSIVGLLLATFSGLLFFRYF